MTINTNYNLQVSVSLEAYKTKDDIKKVYTRDMAKKIGKKPLSFKRVYISINDLLNKLTSGHAYANLFDLEPGKLYTRVNKKTGGKFKMEAYNSDGGFETLFKANEYFRGSQIITIDIDATKWNDVEHYINMLTYKPTLVYMSYSDGLLKDGILSRRFHMLYVFDVILDEREMLRCAKTLHDQVAIDTDEKMADFCGLRVSQYFNGVYGNPETYNTGIIYNPLDIPGDYVEQKEEKVVEFSKWMIRDMESLGYLDFCRKYHMTVIFSTADILKPGNCKYVILDDSWISLYYNATGKIKNGEKRRKKLAKRMGLRKLINPNITPDELLYSAWFDLNNIIDNTDTEDFITVEQLKRRAAKIINMEEFELRTWLDYDLQKQRKQKIHFFGNASQAYQQKVQAAYRYYQVWPIWDFSQNVRENMEREEIKELNHKKDFYYSFLKAVSPLRKRDGEAELGVYEFIDFIISTTTTYIYDKPKIIKNVHQNDNNAQFRENNAQNRENTAQFRENNEMSNTESELTYRAKRQAIRDAKEANLQIFWDNYDPEKPVKDNLSILKGLGMKISQAKLYRLIKEYNNNTEIFESRNVIETVESAQFRENNAQNGENDIIKNVHQNDNNAQFRENSESRFGNFNMDFNLPEFNWDLNYESKR